MIQIVCLNVLYTNKYIKIEKKTVFPASGGNAGVGVVLGVSQRRDFLLILHKEGKVIKLVKS